MLTTLWMCVSSALATSVVGGAAAEAGAWDDTVAVRLGGQWGCTGVLIAPDLVLTAGHCVSGPTVSRVKIGVQDSREDGEEINVVDILEDRKH